MRTIGAVLLTVLLAAAMVGPAAGQVPVVRIIFDLDCWCWEALCPDEPAGTVQDTLYVAASGFTSPISAIEYTVDYPASITWVSDLVLSGSAFGSTPTGIRHFWGSPADASDRLLLVAVTFVWNCEGCDGLNDPVCVVGHPETGKLVGFDWDDKHLIYANGLGGIVCPGLCQDIPLCWTPPSPVQISTWGSIKSLFATTIP